MKGIVKDFHSPFEFSKLPIQNIGCSDNNAAERALRYTVVGRKISGGTRSPKGSETKSILVSLFGTWRLQGKNPLLSVNFFLLRVRKSELLQANRRIVLNLRKW